MKFLIELLELLEKRIQNTEVIDTKDLILIKNAINKVERAETRVNCLVKAAAEAIKIITGYKVSTRDFDNKAKGSAKKGDDDYEKIHPNKLKTVASNGIKINGVDKILHLELNYVSTQEEIKETVRKGIPVILSIVWTDLIFYPVVFITRPQQKERISSYKELGANDEMLKAVKDGIVPYPNDELIKASKEINDPHSHVKHAVLVIGYDAAKKCFICRDYSIHNGDENGIFKVDERIFFDKKLKSEGLSTIEMGLVIEVDDPDA
jgi:hypothetical protein